MSNPNITLTLTSNRVIVIYSNTFRLLMYRESAEISRAEHEYMNIHPPPPINLLAAALNT